jgi:xanthine/uracil permease
MFKKVSLTICAIVVGVICGYVASLLCAYLHIHDMVDTNTLSVMDHANWIFLEFVSGISFVVTACGSFIIPITTITTVWKD